MTKREIRTSAFLDLKPDNEKATSHQLISSDAPLTGTVIGVVDAARGLVEVQVDGGEGSVVALADAGLTYVGAHVSLPRDSSGRVTGVRAPSGETPKDVEVIAIGESGRQILDAQAKVTALDGQLAQAKAEVEANHETVTAKLAETESLISAAQAKVDQVTSEMEEAGQVLEWVSHNVNTANRRITVSSVDPTAQNAKDMPEGALWEVHAQGTCVRRFVLASGQWMQVKAGSDFIGDKAIGQGQIGDGAVTTSKIKVSSDMWVKLLTVAGDATVGGRLLVGGSIGAREVNAQSVAAAVGRFLEITTDQITAGQAKIAGELIATDITGKRITGSMIVAANNDGKSIRILPNGLFNMGPVIHLNPEGKPVDPLDEIQEGTQIILSSEGLTILPGRSTYTAPQGAVVPDSERIVKILSWMNLVAPPWAELVWTMNDMANAPNTPAGEGVLDGTLASVKNFAHSWKGRVGPGGITVPENGFYHITAFTEWRWPTSQANWAVASGVWRKHADDTTIPGAIDWQTLPSSTVPLIPGVTTQASASGAAYLHRGDELQLGYWQNTGAWKPQYARMYVRFLGN